MLWHLRLLNKIKNVIKAGIKVDKSSDSNLLKLAANVLQSYNVKPENITVVQSGSVKTVWKVKTRKRELCLKRLRQAYDQVLFSVNAQIYIKSSGGNVPEVILDKDNSPIVQFNNELFVLYEWLVGRDLSFDNAKDLGYAVRGLAKFHSASKGYEADQGSKISSKAGRWVNQYMSMLKKLTLWKDMAKAQKSNPCSSAYLKGIDSILKMGNLAIELLEKSDYKNKSSENSSSIVLCHQDFGTGNVILTQKDVIVLDLDSVTFDLPARDLRKVIFKLEESNGTWNKKIISNVLESYCSINPLDDSEKEILYIDLLFPHRYLGLAKNIFQNEKSIKSINLDRITSFEQSKMNVLNTLIKIQ